MARGLFVTGTDTGVGKTEVGRALARLLAERGVDARVRKPVESGCERVAGRLVPRDAERLRDAARCRDPLERVCPYPLEAALSPERAAALEGVTLFRAGLREACLAGVGATDFLLVEGAGGFLAPLAPDATVADLAADLGLPLLVVVADRLGCLNHAQLTVEAIERRGLAIAALVLNRMHPSHPAGMDNAADLRKRLRHAVLELPYCAELEQPWLVWREPLAALTGRLAQA
jgi:dethiobiotin synthetase